MLADIQARMVAPMTQAFRKGDPERGVEIFVDYVYRDPHKWQGFSAASKAETMRDAGEWDVIMTTGELFPEVAPAAVRGVATPALLLSGAKSYPFLDVIDEELTRLLPNNRRIVLEGAGHQMWFQRPQACRSAVLAFQAEHDMA
jgi:lipase